MQRNARHKADRQYMETLKKSGIDYDRLRQSSHDGSKAAGLIVDNSSDEEQTRSRHASPGLSSDDERSPGRDPTEHESLSHRSGQVSSSAPDYTQEYDDNDDDSNSVLEEVLG